MHDRRIWLARFQPVILASLFLGLLAFGNGYAARVRGLPAQQGILNFGKIDDRVYRGAKPDAAALSNLERLGIKSIIDLQMPTKVWKAEEAEARAHGILYTNLPLRGVGRPTDNRVKAALSLIETLPGPVFVHCEHGCDRTGTIIACYRIKHDHWSGDIALQEARRYGLSWLERGMKNFVQDFANASARLTEN